jgi:predicted GNAT family N-acyltransferase
MNVYCFAQIEFMSPEYDLCVHLRHEVLRKPLNLEFSEEGLEEEANEFHFGVFNYKLELLGCLSLKPQTADKMKMRQVAIRNSEQGKGIGKYLIQKTETWMVKKQYKIIELNARDTAVEFYLKLDYRKEGEMFKELNIPHWKMIKNLRYEKN